MTHEDTFFDSSLREAISGETPPDVLARVSARSRAEGVKPRELERSNSGRSATGKPTTRRWVIVRVMGALCLSILAGGAVAFASSLLAAAPVSEAKQPSLEELSVKVVAVNAAVSQLENSSKFRALKVEAAEAELARLLERLATPEEKVERALVENERKQRERFEQAEIQRGERHLAWVQEVRKKERQVILDGLVANVSVSPEQQKRAEKVLEDWGNSVVVTIRDHYPEDRRREGHRGEGHGRDERRGSNERRLPDARETMDNVSKLNHATLDSLRGLLDGRQQLAFDAWMSKGGGGALAKGADPWLPPAVDLDDMNSFDEWRR